MENQPNESLPENTLPENPVDAIVDQLEDSISGQVAGVPDGKQTGGSTEGGNSKDQVEFKDIISTITGKTFESDEQALKAVEDTFKFVGKKKQDFAKEAVKNTDNLITRDEYEQDLFFARNKEYEPYKSVISKLREPGQKVEEVISSETFKTLFEKVKIADEVQASKSILHSNSRLNKVTNRMDEARKKIKEADDLYRRGDIAGSTRVADAGKQDLMDSVLDAFEM